VVNCKKLGIVIGLGAFAIALGSVVAHGQAHASVYERVSAITCKPWNHSAGGYEYETTTTGAGWIENLSSGARAFVCPIPSNTALPLQSIVSVRMHVRDSNPAPGHSLDVGGRFCARLANGNNAEGSASCASWTYSSGTHDQLVALLFNASANNPTIHSTETHAYVWVSLPAVYGGAKARLYSIFVADY
jgi:hypothetical protein